MELFSDNNLIFVILAFLAFGIKYLLEYQFEKTTVMVQKIRKNYDLSKY